MVCLFIRKIFWKSNTNIFCSYKFGLVIKHDKSEVFHFSRATKNFSSLPSDLRSSEGIVPRPKDIWWYFGFFFNRKLLFWYHTHHYTNKLLSIINCIKMLRNSTRGLSPVYKWLLYRTCVLSITLYSFQLWYFKGAPLYHLLKSWRKCKEKWLFGSQEFFVLLYHGELRLLLASSLFILISTKLAVGIILEYHCSQAICYYFSLRWTTFQE